MNHLSVYLRSHRKMLAILAGGIGLVWLSRSQFGGFSEWITDREAIITSIEQLGIWGPIVLFALLVLQVFFALIPGHALMVAGSFAFGFWPSFFITIVATVFGSQIAFWAARRWGRSTVYQLADRNIIERWDRLADKQGAMFYFFSFVLPIFPSDLMTYVAGLGTISPKRFFIANICGRSIVAGFITLLGARNFNLPLIFWVAAGLGMGILFIGWKAYAKGQKIRSPSLGYRQKIKKRQLL